MSHTFLKLSLLAACLAVTFTLALQATAQAWDQGMHLNQQIIMVKKPDKPGNGNGNGNGNQNQYNPSHGNGPPPWAPAHGYRAKHQYQYWPNAQVYFDPDRDLYFYNPGLVNNVPGEWIQSQQLPDDIRIRMNIGDFVDIEMDVDNPFEFHDAVHRWYPGF